METAQTKENNSLKCENTKESVVMRMNFAMQEIEATLQKYQLKMSPMIKVPRKKETDRFPLLVRICIAILNLHGLTLEWQFGHNGRDSKNEIR